MLLVEYFSCFSVGGKLCIPWYIATHLQMVVRRIEKWNQKVKNTRGQ
jgi:hypothetical protein